GDGVRDRDLRRERKGPQALVVSRFLAEVDQHLPLALEKLADRIDNARGADLFVLIGGEGALETESVDRPAVARRENLRADDRGILHGAGASDEGKQARMVGRIKTDL